MSKRQLAMVMDLNKCIGCQTCTVACKTQWTNRNGREYMYWNNVETHPGTGYPRNWMEAGGGFDEEGNLRDGIIPDMVLDYGVPWDYNHDELFNGDLLKPNTAPEWGPNWDEDVGGGEYPNSYFFYIPRICNHCSNPGCLAACPREAIFKREQDGIVLVDLERCQGYRYCIAGCPYKKIYFNPKISKSEKCIFCFPRVEKGLPPACAHQCVGRIRFVGFLDDEEGQVYKLVHKYKVALPLRPDFGTQPNVYYVPPLFDPPKLDDNMAPIDNSRRVPIEYLELLFGKEVHQALETLRKEMEKRARGEESELMDILIAYSHRDMFRLDNNYYQQTADKKLKATEFFKVIDQRYLQGANTKKVEIKDYTFHEKVLPLPPREGGHGH
ncbi:MAG TPA: respiratory nitrate reductase subunit beta [Sulfurihydrogenibium sp.]|uniref:4Fe-4S dicluster domain-containing protein n=1 Tax=Sulfurihydrogenibium sp. (strain YO3AOP1) TaxID=436114 RepID=UPI0001750C5D|nr:4Fe-4S dicluster domain-containing protein [Sulfurihydrogenibium sp. YO3AOP1]ACD66788.1 DMSO reductase family type II enzyme, iron-sulfur subunit [Sulfurihydrogenibium sp. YO3AOP1]HBT99249.1 respiratory nitrate reductase subunit beta [Sulfurihydrogenibium sp.]